MAHTVRHLNAVKRVGTMPEALAVAREWESLGFRPVLIDSEWSEDLDIRAEAMEWER